MTDRSDARMKELVGRVVAMAPEAPPYPTAEVGALSPHPPRRRRPWLALVGAATVVLLLVGVPLLMTGGGQDPGTEPSTSPTTQVTPSAVEPTSPTTLPPTTVPMVDAIGVIYLAAVPDGSIGGNPTMVPVRRMVSAEAYEPHVIEALLDGLVATDPEEAVTLIPGDVELRGVGRIGDPVLTIDLTAAFAIGSGQGLLGDMTMLNQIVYTATALPGVEAVEFLVEGEADPIFGADGLILDGPIDRTTFADGLALIVLDQPVHGAPAGEVITISGIANVFEATVSYEVVDGSGAVVASGFTTATCGTGCWGEFRADVPLPDGLSGDAGVVAFWESAEDGSRHDVIRRAITAGFVCPVTLPDPEGFVPPSPWPAQPVAPGDVWYGTAELWTALPIDGDYGLRKSVWWSSNFPGGLVEEQPPLSVTWERLDDGDAGVQASEGATNAYTVEDGWFMIAGIDPDESGCFRATASYKGATLSYVYQSPRPGG